MKQFCKYMQNLSVMSICICKCCIYLAYVCIFYTKNSMRVSLEGPAVDGSVVKVSVQEHDMLWP